MARPGSSSPVEMGRLGASDASEHGEDVRPDKVDLLADHRQRRGSDCENDGEHDGIFDCRCALLVAAKAGIELLRPVLNFKHMVSPVFNDHDRMGMRVSAKAPTAPEDLLLKHLQKRKLYVPFSI